MSAIRVRKIGGRKNALVQVSIDQRAERLLDEVIEVYAELLGRPVSRSLAFRAALEVLHHHLKSAKADPTTAVSEAARMLFSVRG